MRIISVLDEFIRKEKFTNPIKSEELRNELFLDFDNFNQPKIKKDNYALAQLILNLLLTEPGTYPDTPELGINIAQYQFEFLNSRIGDLNDHLDEIVEQTSKKFGIIKENVIYIS